MLTGDRQLNQIIKKVLGSKKHSNKSSQVDTSVKYTPEVCKDPQRYNYQLQIKNAELMGKYRELEKILKYKNKQKMHRNQIKKEIEATTQKLKDILNQNQTMELSLSKLRVVNSNMSMKNTVEDSYNQCCCSRVKSHKNHNLSQSSLQNKTHSNNRSVSKLPETANNEEQQQQTITLTMNTSPDRTDRTTTNRTSLLYNNHKIVSPKDLTLIPIQQQQAVQSQDIGVTCNFDYLEQQRQKITDKSQYLGRLQAIIAQQNKVLLRYEGIYREENHVGKITACKTLKKSIRMHSGGKLLLNKNGSVGSIVRTKREVEKGRPDKRGKLII